MFEGEQSFRAPALVAVEGFLHVQSIQYTIGCSQRTMGILYHHFTKMVLK